MLVLCLILSMTHYAQNYAGIIGKSPIEWWHALYINLMINLIKFSGSGNLSFR